MKRGRARVLVVADSDVRPAMIEAALRDHADVDVVVGRHHALGHLLEEHDPTIVVLASAATRTDAALATLAGVLRAPPVILLVDEPRVAWTAAARRAGVRAVLGRDATADQLVAAVGAATAGLIALHPNVFRAPADAAVLDAGHDRVLTDREREILEMMAEGLSNRAIAARLGISRYTVKFHVASILGKLGAGSRTEAVTLGVRSGLISL